MPTYTAGAKVRILVTFTDNTGALIDPGTVSLKYALPNVANVSQTYNPGNIVRDSLGVYHYDLDTTGSAPGALRYEWLGTGSGQAAGTGLAMIEALPY